MRHQPVDRVPVMCQLAIGHYLLNTDVSPSELWFTSEGFAHALVALQRRYRFDGILVNLPGRDPDWRRDVMRIERRPNGDEVIYWKNGDTSFCPHDDNVQHFPSGGRRHPTLEEVDPDRLYYDDPHAVGGLKYPFYYGLHPYTPDPNHYWPPYLLRTLDLVRQEAGPDVSVHGEVFSPFTQFLELLGYENALIALLEDAGKCHAILAAYARGTADYAARLVEWGVDAVLLSSAFAGGGFISRAQYQEFVLPYERLVHEAVRAKGGLSYTHTCGAIGDRLELMVDSGTGGIDTLDPPPLGTVDLEEAKARVGDKVFLKGNIDPVNTLLRGNVEQVRADARYRIRVGAPGSGYILSSACSVAPRVPPENLKVLVEVSEEMRCCR